MNVQNCAGSRKRKSVPELDYDTVPKSVHSMEISFSVPVDGKPGRPDRVVKRRTLSTEIAIPRGVTMLGTEEVIVTIANRLYVLVDHNEWRKAQDKVFLLTKSLEEAREGWQKDCKRFDELLNAKKGPSFLPRDKPAPTPNPGYQPFNPKCI